MRGKLRALEDQGINLDDLPEGLGRPYSTAAELIDEYYSVTLTRGVTPPDPTRLRDWLAWSEQT